MARENTLMDYYKAMLEHFGASQWWPADSPFEVALGAILTQNTSWKNVEKSINHLKSIDALNPAKLWNLPQAEMEEALRSSGFFRLKAVRLRNFLAFLAQSAGQDAPPEDLELGHLQSWDTFALREALLEIKGVGQETADSILLYALHRPIFVVDAYTHRLCVRHGFLSEEADYLEMQEFFMDVLPLDTSLFNEFHALIVRTLSTYCKKSKPLCEQCPLGGFLG